MDKKQMQHYYEAYAEMIYRLGFTYMKNASDAEDVVQETFLRLVRQTAHFTNEEHVKAWLIVTASNRSIWLSPGDRTIKPAIDMMSLPD